MSATLVPYRLVADLMPLSRRQLRDLRPAWLQRLPNRLLVADWPGAREWFLQRYGVDLNDLAHRALAAKPALVARLRNLK